MRLRRMAAVWLLAAAAWPQSPLRFQEVMIPMGDRARLQTAILTPAGRKNPLPILLRRTPYGVRRSRLSPAGSPYVPAGSFLSRAAAMVRHANPDGQ